MISSRSFHAEMCAAIKALELDLSGLNVLTEAANDVYTATPLIACMAGARNVFAVGKNSRYGSFEDTRDELLETAQEFSIDTTALNVVHRDEFDDYESIDIVTNLGHVRPIDLSIVQKLRRECVISFMSESWEYRDGDINLESCRSRRIKVAGVNEEHELVDCFRETGTIAVKEMIEARVSLPYADVLVVSRDKFGHRIRDSVSPLCKSVDVLRDYSGFDEGLFKKYSVIIVADYLFQDVLIGNNGIIKPEWLSESCTVIQYCGSNSIEDLNSAKIDCYPPGHLDPHRMSQTLGEASFRSIIRLYAGGLKVGQVIAEGDENGTWKRLVQPMNY